MSARRAVLLDEEIALLAPGAGPLPALDALDDVEHDAALRATARSLLVRGLAERAGDGLQPGAALAPLVLPLLGQGPQLQLVCPLPGAEPTLTVLRLLPDGLVHLQDVSEDGVHLLTLVDVDHARTQLRGVLDPLGVAASTPPGALPDDVLSLLEQPEAAVRLQTTGPPARTLTVVTAGGRCWGVEAAADAEQRPPPALQVRPLDAAALDELVQALLPGRAGVRG